MAVDFPTEVGLASADNTDEADGTKTTLFSSSLTSSQMTISPEATARMTSAPGARPTGSAFSEHILDAVHDTIKSETAKAVQPITRLQRSLGDGYHLGHWPLQRCQRHLAVEQSTGDSVQRLQEPEMIRPEEWSADDLSRMARMDE